MLPEEGEAAFARQRRAGRMEMARVDVAVEGMAGIGIDEDPCLRLQFAVAGDVFGWRAGIVPPKWNISGALAGSAMNGIVRAP